MGIVVVVPVGEVQVTGSGLPSLASIRSAQALQVPTASSPTREIDQPEPMPEAVSPASSRLGVMKSAAPSETRSVVLDAGLSPTPSRPVRGFISGSMLIVRRSPPPGDSTSKATSAPGSAKATAITTSENVLIGAWSTDTIRSPGRRPASAAGSPGKTSPTIGALNCTPLRKAAMNSTTAVITFMTIPALITTIRFPIGTALKLRGSLLRAPGSMSSCPSILTYPPRGITRSAYSVSPTPASRSSSVVHLIEGLPRRATVAASVLPSRKPTPIR